MGKIITTIIINGIIVFLAAHFLDGVNVSNSYVTAIFAGVVLGLANNFIKPILSFFAAPITFLTFGLFAIVINAALVLLAANLVSGFHVGGWVDAMLFGFFLAIANYILGRD